MWKQCVVLEDQTDIAGMRRELRQIPVAETDGAARGLQEPGDEP